MSLLEAATTCVHRCLSNKGLQLNAETTQFLPVRKSHISPDAIFHLQGAVITSSATAIYLGLVIDEHLTFQPQINSLRTKVGAKLCTYRRICTMLTMRAKQTFYLSFIQSSLEYASNAYIHTVFSLIKARPSYFFNLPQTRATIGDRASIGDRAFIISMSQFFFPASGQSAQQPGPERFHTT